MTRNNSSILEPFDLEIEKTLRRLCNLVEEKVSPKKERPTMEETRVFGAANIAGAGVSSMIDLSLVGETFASIKLRSLLQVISISGSKGSNVEVPLLVINWSNLKITKEKKN